MNKDANKWPKPLPNQRKECHEGTKESSSRLLDYALLGDAFRERNTDIEQVAKELFEMEMSICTKEFGMTEEESHLFLARRDYIDRKAVPFLTTHKDIAQDEEKIKRLLLYMDIHHKTERLMNGLKNLPTKDDIKKDDKDV